VGERRLQHRDQLVVETTPGVNLGVRPDSRPEADQRAAGAAGSEHELSKLAQHCFPTTSAHGQWVGARRQAFSGCP
jgi:hypothetical protein